jgi:hypothetical protein
VAGIKILSERASNLAGETMLGKTYLSLAVALFLTVGAAHAQEKKPVPPPPKPADEGPSLEATMKFIQDKVNGIGPINYVLEVHNDSTGENWTNHFRSQVTNFSADAIACRISYHWKAERDGTVLGEWDRSWNLKTVEDIVVMPREQEQKEIDTAGGHPSWSYRVVPPVFLIKVRRTEKLPNVPGYFFDEQLANRIAKAMVHAAELCGAGANPEPF